MNFNLSPVPLLEKNLEEELKKLSKKELLEMRPRLLEERADSLRLVEQIKLLKTPSQEEVKKHNDLIVRIKIINGDLEKIVENLNKLQKKIDPDEALRYATVEDDHSATIRLDNSFPKGEAVSPDKFYEISMGGSRIPVGEINPKDFQDTVQDKNDSQHTNHDTANVTLIDPKPIV